MFTWRTLFHCSLVAIIFLTLTFIACSKRDPANPIDQTTETETTLPDVDKLILQAYPQHVQLDTVGTAGESEIIVITKKDDNRPVVNVEVLLSTDLGFINGQVYTDSISGSASATLNNAGFDGIANVRAEVITKTDTLTEYVSVQFDVAEGPNPDNETLRLTANPEIIFADNNQSTSLITVKLTDNSGEPIPDRTIYFQAVDMNSGEAIGSIPQTAITDESGQDTLRFRDEGDEGVAKIIGRAGSSIESSARDSVFVTVNPVPSNQISNIELEVDDFDIQVRGTGEDETARYYANVYDENNNPVPDGVEVSFSIIGAMLADSLIYLNIPYLKTDTTLTSGGVATVLLYSGYMSGTAKVRASAGTISAENVQVVIAAGSPRWIDVSYDSEGEQIGGGLWQIGISASVDDQYGNAVSHGTAVHFQLHPPEHAAFIYPFAYTGNPAHGTVETDSTEGVAFTYLAYGVDEMFTEVGISASSDTVLGTVLATLPFQDVENGVILLTVLPPIVYCGGGTATTTATATLLDGYGAPVAGGTIIFQNQVAGQILLNPVDTNEDGQAITVVQFTQDDFPGETEQVSASIQAQLAGYELFSDEISITVFR